MVEISPDYEFEGPDGKVRLSDLFEGRDQLILYHFWFPAGGEPCNGCSMFADQIGHLAHINERDTTIALLARASQPELQAFKRRMGWEIPWYTVSEDFQQARDTTGWFELDVYLSDGDRVFLTYETRARGVEALGPIWTFLDLTPFGRQEEWEDTPPGARRGPSTSGGGCTTSTGRAPRRRPDDPRPRCGRAAGGVPLGGARRGRNSARAARPRLAPLRGIA